MKEMKRIFVTGANGLLGTNLISKLISEGYIVTGLVRKKSAYKGDLHSNLTLKQGTLFEDLTPYLEGQDCIVHAAAETSQSILSYSEYWKINYNATVQLYNSAVQSGVSKFIFVSTANTRGYGSKENPGNENIPVRFPFSDSLYAKSKIQAEKYLISDKEKLDVVILNPTFMIGAYDTKPSSGRIILMAINKKVIFYPPGGKNFVDVDDVVQGVITAMNKGKSGESYVLSGQNLSYLEFFRKVNKELDQQPTMIAVPRSLLITLGYFGDLLRFIGIKTSVSSTNMRILSLGNYYSNNKSVCDLGLEYRSIEPAIRKAVLYFRKML